MSNHAGMITPRRITAWVLALTLPASACGGGGPSDADRAAVGDMLERLGRSSVVAECMAEELGEDYEAADFQPLIDGRGDYTDVDLELLSDIVLAERDCAEDK